MLPIMGESDGAFLVQSAHLDSPRDESGKHKAFR
jgi:hypothetical protein